MWNQPVYTLRRFASGRSFLAVTGVVALTVCAVFAENAIRHVTEAALITDVARSPVVARSAPPTIATRVKDRSSFVARNMFCSTCTTTVAPGDSVTPFTAAPLRLLATDIGAADAESFATIVNTESQAQGAYGIGALLPGAGVVVAIKYRYVDVQHDGRIERLALLDAAPKAAPKEKPPADLDEQAAAVDAGIKKIDATTFEIDRQLIDQVVANPMAFAKGGRALPTPTGIKLSALRPDSVFTKLGLASGDTLAAVNTIELTSADRALAAFTTLREATSFELAVTRRGKPIILKYRVP